MQSFTDLHRYETSSSTVLDCFTDPGFLLKKYAALGREDIEILEYEKDAQRARLRIRYSDKADMDLPDFARKLVPERATVIQEVEWDLLRRNGRIKVEGKNSPVRMLGEMQLQDQAGGCLNTVRWEVSVSVPLIGGKLEKLLMEGVRQKSRRDEKVSRELLGTAAGG